MLIKMYNTSEGFDYVNPDHIMNLNYDASTKILTILFPGESSEYPDTEPSVAQAILEELGGTE